MSEPTNQHATSEIGTAIAVLERAFAMALVSDLPTAIGDLERLKTLAWLRLNTPTVSASTRNESDSIEALTTAKLGELWGKPEAFIRALCRNRAIPCIKPGKEYLIPRAPLLEWMKGQQAGVANGCSVTLQSPSEARGATAAASPTPTYSAEIRRVARRKPGDGSPVGDGRHRNERDDRAANRPARYSRSNRRHEDSETEAGAA